MLAALTPAPSRVEHLADCLEPFMKHNNIFRKPFVKRQDKEELLWYSLVNQFREVPETEPLIVGRITHKSATLAAQLFQQGQPFADKGFSDSSPVKLR